MVRAWRGGRAVVYTQGSAGDDRGDRRVYTRGSRWANTSGEQEDERLMMSV